MTSYILCGLGRRGSVITGGLSRFTVKLESLDTSRGVSIVISVSGVKFLTDCIIHKFVLKKPSGKELILDAIVKDETHMSYVFQKSELNELGFYFLQVYLRYEKWTGFSSTTTFKISKKDLELF